MRKLIIHPNQLYAYVRVCVFIIVLLFPSCIQGQDTVRTTRTVTVFAEPNLKSRTYFNVYAGSTLVLGNVSGEFREARYRKNNGYLHQSSYPYCIPDTAMPRRSKKVDANAGKSKFRPYETFRIYPIPSLNSLTHKYVEVGSTLFIGEKQDEFFEVAYENKLRFMHESSYSLCLPYDTPLPKKVIVPTPEYFATPGEELSNAGTSLIYSWVIPSVGALIGTTLIFTLDDPLPGIIIDAVSGIVGSVLLLRGYSKIKRAGDKLGFTPASTGIGLAFHLK